MRGEESKSKANKPAVAICIGMDRLRFNALWRESEYRVPCRKRACSGVPTDCISVWKSTNKEHRGHLLSDEHASVSLKPTLHVML